MTANTDVISADRQFFTALVKADIKALAEILAEDFFLIDLGGSTHNKTSFLSMLQSGNLRFEKIEPISSQVRLFGPSAVVSGRTEMKGSAVGTAFSASSLYTHVYVLENGAWRLAVAQGTQAAVAV